MVEFSDVKKPELLNDYTVRIVNDPVTDTVIVIPTTKEGFAQAMRTAAVMLERAGSPAQLVIVVDNNRNGWVAAHNYYSTVTKKKYYLYCANDYYPGRRYLSIAKKELLNENNKLIGFNDGKWFGGIATAGLAELKWARRINSKDGGGIFPNCYKSHYAETELTIKAKQERAYAYCPEALLVEVDHNKIGNPNNKKDNEVYKSRGYTLKDYIKELNDVEGS